MFEYILDSIYFKKVGKTKYTEHVYYLQTRFDKGVPNAAVAAVEIAVLAVFVAARIWEFDGMPADADCCWPPPPSPSRGWPE